MGKTIIFDVDGTLLDTERLYMEAWKEAGKGFGYQISHEVLLQTRAVNGAVADACFRRAYGEDFPIDDIYEERVKLSEAWIAEKPARELHKPFAVQTLQALKQQGYTLAVASTTSKNKTLDHLSHAGLLSFFQVVVCGDMVEHGKPEPDIFLKAAALCGAEPGQCLVVGDSPADVNAATAAGMKIILIPDQVPLNPHTQSLSWKVLDDLEEVPALVKLWDNQ